MKLVYLEKFYEQTKDLYCIPCSQDEITKLEESVGSPLPDAYKEFLLLMGKGAHGFMTGSDVFYHLLFDLTEGAHELLIEDKSPLILPEKAFVFWMHQGYQFLFFNLNEGPDPKVYYYLEGKKITNFEDKGVFSEYISQFI
ncbi:SMI1/KNR4 family protein [Cytophagaceae bacterium YF14B1]|uniref:SMI1/KNR4 family protein n=1 Tax=Xanthocytophaga flava TaxID=3048013 RepID=A0AAE3QU44_9BACT|nr:SMI1/KNR4 family protein [Xanthocytophaga flavus]MDJ1485505.1 SMI1/KNR4 family protein [Xanthocytophaga flavus]